MYDLILASVIFHTLSSLTLLVGCSVAAFARSPQRATAYVLVDQLEMDADAILSAPVAVTAQPGFSPVLGQSRAASVA